MSAEGRVITGGKVIAGRIQQDSGKTSWSAEVSLQDVKVTLIDAKE
jgi:hypothetical protein